MRAVYAVADDRLAAFIDQLGTVSASSAPAPDGRAWSRCRASGYGKAPLPGRGAFARKALSSLQHALSGMNGANCPRQSQSCSGDEAVNVSHFSGSASRRTHQTRPAPTQARSTAAPEASTRTGPSKLRTPRGLAQSRDFAVSISERRRARRRTRGWRERRRRPGSAIIPPRCQRVALIQGGAGDQSTRERAR